MSQLYEVAINIKMSDAQECLTVLVCAQNADQAVGHACVHARIAPSMCSADVRRVKGNAYTVSERVMPAKIVDDAKNLDVQSIIDASTDDDAKRLTDACKIQSRTHHAPRLSKKVVEMRATIYSRTDESTMCGVGKALIERGRTGAWRSMYAELEDLKVKDDDERRPNNPRAITNAQYVGARVFRT